MAPNSGSGDLPPHVQRLLAAVAGEKAQVIWKKSDCNPKIGSPQQSVTGGQPGRRVGWGEGGDCFEEGQGGDRGLVDFCQEGKGCLTGRSTTCTASIQVCPAFHYLVFCFFWYLNLSTAFTAPFLPTRHLFTGTSGFYCAFEGWICVADFSLLELFYWWCLNSDILHFALFITCPRISLKLQRLINWRQEYFQ